MLRRKTQPYREKVAGELEMLPMMNLFVVLIPMLLLSAVFLEMAVIRMNLPDDDSKAEETTEALGLSIAIEDAHWVVEGRRLEPQVISRTGVDPEIELRSALVTVTAQHPDNRDVVIRSRDRTRYDDIVRVMDVSREAGLDNISLAGAN